MTENRVDWLETPIDPALYFEEISSKKRKYKTAAPKPMLSYNYEEGSPERLQLRGGEGALKASFDKLNSIKTLSLKTYSFHGDRWNGVSLLISNVKKIHFFVRIKLPPKYAWNHPVQSVRKECCREKDRRLTCITRVYGRRWRGNASVEIWEMTNTDKS